ncbi:hypothetical protein ACFQW8_10450 [Knoellia sp. GCM10030254]|uniref:hypothetical protein n=1 Tax=Knoellia altitudinis TaxID=3404795 RepID=UPI00360EC4F4
MTAHHGPPEGEPGWRGEDPRRAHARGLPEHRQRPAVARDPPPGIGDREDPQRLRLTGAPGPAVIVGISDMGDRFRLTFNEVEVVEPDHDLPKLPVACAVWEPRPSLSTSAECWLLSGGPHHTVLSRP